jgi:polyhydroxyalkanoate synthase
LSLANYVLDFVGGSVARVKHESGEPDVSVIGYCMGGVLSLLWSALQRGDAPKNLAVFTTPVDFKEMKLFQAWSDPKYFDVDRLVDTLGLAPSDMLFASFDMLRPGQRVAGNIRLLDNLWDDEFVKAHRMFDRWSTDILPLAGEYFRETTRKLVWENALMNGTMTVAGRPVDLGAITCPFLHATAQHDHIVTTAASAPLIEMIGSRDKEAVVLKGGHVSLIAGPNAVRRLWPKLDEWLGEKSV